MVHGITLLLPSQNIQTSILLLWTFFNMALQSLQSEFSVSGKCRQLENNVKKVLFCGGRG